MVLAELTPTINVDSEIDHVQRKSKALFLQELGFAVHLGVPVVKICLTKRHNGQLGRLVNEKLVHGFNSSFWVTVPMVHPSQYSPICGQDEKDDSWEWWNDFRTYCNYDKHVGVVLELPEVRYIPTKSEVDRWIGEPVRALIVPTSYFIMNTHGKPVLSRLHQELIQRFLSIDVQYIIKTDTEGDLSVYTKYLHFLGKKLYVSDTNLEFIQGCEDFLQNPLQPLTEHLETNIYEVFEKDQIKYTTYQNAIQKALEDVPADVTIPTIMVVGAGRGPLVQAALNVSYILHRKVKVYAVEKNPYAINTLIDRVKHEWSDQVTLINDDMRVYEPPEKADILVSELLGSFGDNELSPECLDGAQRFLKRNGISIPCSYTSYLAPLQSIKIFNEIRNNRPADKTLKTCYETPYVIHLVNYYQIAPAQALFKFEHPNWSDVINNERYKKLRFNCTQTCILTGFVGFFDTVLYKDVTLSIHPETHTHEMVSWFPIVFPLMVSEQFLQISVSVFVCRNL